MINDFLALVNNIAVRVRKNPTVRLPEAEKSTAQRQGNSISYPVSTATTVQQYYPTDAKEKEKKAKKAAKEAGI